jgi:hypothetical protein
MNKKILFSLAGVVSLIASGFIFTQAADAQTCGGDWGWQARELRQERRLAHMRFERQMALQREFGYRPAFNFNPSFAYRPGFIRTRMGVL